MKNKEKYAKEIVEIAKDGHNVAVNEDGRPQDCVGFYCCDCLLSPGGSEATYTKSRREWFEREAKKTLTEEINEEIEIIEKIGRQGGRLSSASVVDMLKQIRSAVQKEEKKKWNTTTERR